MAEEADHTPDALRGPLAVGAAVFVLAFACLAIPGEIGRAAPVWPVNAVLLAALLRAPNTAWLRFLAAGLCGALAANLAAGDGLALSIGLASCNELEVALAAVLLRRFAGVAPDLTERRTLARFLLVGGLVAPGVSALLAGLILYLRGPSPFWPTALTWYAADALGLVTVTPALLAVTRSSLRRLRQRLRQGAGGLSLALLAAAVGMVFWISRYPLFFLVPPALIFVAFELELAGAALALLACSVAAVWATLDGHGPAELIHGPMSARLAVLELFLATLTVSVLPVAVTLAKQTRFRGGLRAALTGARAARRQLAEAQRLSRLAEQLAGIGYWRLEVATGHSIWSDQMYVIHGVTREDFEGRIGDTVHLYDLESQAQMQTTVRHAARTGEPFEVKVRMTRGDDGERRTVMFRGEAERDGGGRPVAIFGVMRDITEDERAAHELQKSEAEFRELADAAPDVIVRVGRDRTIEFVSAAIARYGHAPAALVGTPVLDMVHPEERAKVAAMHAAALGERPQCSPQDRTYRLRMGDGDYAWVQGNPAIVRDDKGEMVAVISHLRDVSTQEAAATALAESEARFRLLADSATDLLLQVDADDNIMYISPSISRYGYAPEALIGTKGASYIHPDDLPAVLDRVARVNRGETIDRSVDLSYRMLTADGGHVWIEGSSSAVRDASGAVQSVICQLRDVSNRRAALEALSESEARYRLLAYNMTDVIACYGRDGRLTYLSPAVEALLGYTAEELVGSSIMGLIHPEDLAACDVHFKAHIAEGPGAKPFHCEYRVTKKSGEQAWLEAHPRAIYDPDTGAFVEWQDVVRDITERKAMDAALADSELRYRLIAEQASDVISRFDAQGRFTYLSPSFETVTGYEIGAMIGEQWLPFVHPDDHERLTVTYRALREGALQPGEAIRYRARHKAGHWIWLESKPGVIRDATGAVVEFIDVTRDAGSQVELEAQLRTARDEAQSAAATKADFMANMSHEIRTPLTAILGFTNLLDADESLGAEAKGRVARVAGAGEALLTIVNDVLDFSKLEAGLFEIRPEPCSPDQVLHDAVLMFQPQAQAKGLELRCDGMDVLPPTLLIDRHRLRQVLTNLIGNAIKFTDAGHITLAAAYDTRLERMSLAVEDSGAGLDKDQQERMFVRYSQVDASAAKRAGGTGLGLVICRGLVEAMGGELGVSSQLGVGSTFHFTIAAPVAEAGSAAVGPVDDAGLSGARILVADDDAANRELARALLGPLDVEVTAVADGAAALEAAMASPFDLILLDMRMPGLSGPEVAAQVRAGGGPNTDIPILAFTGDAERDDLGDAADFDGVIPKPVSQAELTEAVRRHLTWFGDVEPVGAAATA